MSHPKSQTDDLGSQLPPLVYLVDDQPVLLDLAEVALRNLRASMSHKRWDELVGSLRQTLGALPDPRTGDNTRYSMADIGLSVFPVFFTQSPSFLNSQKTLEQAKGRSNAQSLFQSQAVPCDNHIRQSLDAVAPDQLFPLYDEVYQALRQAGLLENFRAGHQTRLIALDGTLYFSSQKIHCAQCCCLEHKSGDKTYYHSAVTPVLVAPGQPQAIALRPECITPQDGHTKPDCEIAAAKRWLEKNKNTVKTKGYHLEHNFGHGQEHLASLLAALNILAFLYHTFLSCTDQNYRLIRAQLPTRQTFFDDLRALTR